MTAVLAFIRSLGLKTVRPALYGWFFNFAFSFLIYYGFYKAFILSAGETLVIRDNGESLNVFNILMDAIRYSKGNLVLIFSFALILVAGYLLVSIYVSGGIYSVLVDNERTTFTNLIGDSTLNFFDMAKIAAINLLTLLVSLIVPVLLLVVLRIFSHGKIEFVDNLLGGYFMWIWLAVTALCLSFTIAVYDFSRIFKLKNAGNVWLSFKQGLKYIFSNPFNVLIIFLLYALLLVIFSLIFYIFMDFAGHLLYSWMIFLFYQLFIMARYYLKVVVIRAEIKLVSE